MGSPSEEDADLFKSLSDSPDAAFFKDANHVHRILANFRWALEQHNAIFIANVSGKIVYVNKEFCKLCKYSSEDLINQSMNTLGAGLQSKESYAHLWSTVSSGHVWRGIMKGRANDGSVYCTQTSMFPLTDDQGSKLGYLVVGTDISNEVELCDKNRRLTEQLEEEHRKLIGKKQALIGMIEHIDEEKLKILRDIKTNFEVSIFPLLDQVLEKHPKEDKYLQVLKQNLANIAKPIFDQTRDWKSKLTAKEMQICSLIKQGLVIKEIAPIMHLSPRTIEKHRENIRKKLGLTERKMNLSAYLIEQGL